MKDFQCKVTNLSTSNEHLSPPRLLSPRTAAPRLNGHRWHPLTVSSHVFSAPAAALGIVWQSLVVWQPYLGC
jgi:hypothetical protein